MQLLLLLLLSGCGGSSPVGLSTALPGLNVARAALDGGSPEIALRISARIVTENPNDVDALVIEGDAFAGIDDRVRAEAAYRRAIALAPESVGARMGLGRLQLAMSPVAAEAVFLDVLARDPRNAKALNDLGIARDLQGRHADAQSAYRQALGVAPEMQAVVINLALSLALSGHTRDGELLLRPLASSPQVRHNLAAVTAMGGDRHTAQTLLSPDLTGPQTQDALQYDGGLSPKAPE